MVKVRTMNVMFRVVLAGALIGVLAACSGTGAVQKSDVAPAAAPVGPAGLSGEPMLVSVKAESVPTPRLVLHTNGNPVYTSYSPQPDVFVVDLPRTAKANGLDIPTNLPAEVASVSVDEAFELGRPLTRVTLRFKQASSPSASSEGDAVVVSLPADSVPAIAVAAPVVEPVVELPQVATVVTEELPEAPAPALAPQRNVAHVSSAPATSLETVQVTGSGASLAVDLETDGKVEYSTFRLSNPLRLVVDVKGVRNEVATKTIDVADPLVRQVRVSQFKSSPDPVARVVLDLDEAVEHNVTRTANGLRITFGGATIEPAVVAETPRSEPPVVVAKSTPAPAENVFAEAPVSVAAVPDVSPIAPIPYERHVVNSPEPQTAPQPRSIPRPGDNVFNEPPTTTTTTTTTTGTATLGGGTAGAGGSRTLTSGEKVYTGEPIDLELKEADIKDVLRTFAQLTGLNIAIDPNVNGTVTVSFDDVPWDQALEIILKQNGLTYVLQGNVMRVGTIDRLSAEAARIRKLEEEDQLNVPLQTVILHVSYAKAATVTNLLKKMASKRGQIDSDARTNQIIITEIPAYLSTMLNLVETLDIPTPQVAIEARVVETTKQFARQLGISWGFNGALDPALGTGTGLVFPNTITAVGGPFNFASGNPVLTLSLGNVLGTFDLDIALSAAESEGLLRVVSAPKVVTQDNEAAEIQSGVQIPVQTRVNLTTTVSYVDATLRLSVTPQITTADTVIMEITVQKSEPVAGFNIVGSTNVPLITRRATTKLMVRDGGTAVIGGIYQSSESRGQDRLPFVSEIPIIGNLFKNNDINTRHDELLIFITPRIVRNT